MPVISVFLLEVVLVAFQVVASPAVAEEAVVELSKKGNDKKILSFSDTIVLSLF